MLVARSVLAVAVQGLAAALLAGQSSISPSHDAEIWFPVYDTLIDAGSLACFDRVAVSSLLVYGHVGGLQFSAPLRLVGSLYAILGWPLI